MVDDLLASNCATVWQATGILNLISRLGCSHGSCTDVPIFRDLSGNQNHPGTSITFDKIRYVVLIMEGVLWRTGRESL
jgi:hypothetical protein